MSSIDLGRTLRKLLAAFRTFRHQFFPDGNRNRCTHAAALVPPSKDATHTAGKTFSERLPHSECREIPTSGFAHTLAQSCYVSHSVATSLRIILSRKKKSVPESNDQPTYVFLSVQPVLQTHSIPRNIYVRTQKEIYEHETKKPR